MSGWFNGEVLNDKGEVIFIPYDIYRRFRKYKIQDGSGKVIKALTWNKPRGMWQLTGLAVCLLDLWRVGPDRRAIYDKLGATLDGLPVNPVRPRPENKYKEGGVPLPEGYGWGLDGLPVRIPTP